MFSSKYLKGKPGQAPVCVVCGRGVVKVDRVKLPDGSVRHKTCKLNRRT